MSPISPSLCCSKYVFPAPSEDVGREAILRFVIFRDLAGLVVQSCDALVRSATTLRGAVYKLNFAAGDAK